jgi:hypothetical protein
MTQFFSRNKDNVVISGTSKWRDSAVETGMLFIYLVYVQYKKVCVLYLLRIVPLNVASSVKLFRTLIWRHITTRPVDSLHLLIWNLQDGKENLSGDWKRNIQCSETGHITVVVRSGNFGTLLCKLAEKCFLYIMVYSS